MSEPPKPFNYTYSSNVPELLQGLNCSLAVSTYQTGKVVLFSPKDSDTLTQLPRNFVRPMGMALKNNTLAIALKSQVIITTNSPGLAKNYPVKPNTYDALFVPRSSFYTGPLDIHDLVWTDKGLIGVNTLFSCLVSLSHTQSFLPVWKPNFISDLQPEDRCHLNGLALKDEKPKYVTALGSGNERLSWKEGMLSSGILMDVESNEIIIGNLPSPHSPRHYDDGLYMLLSATGQLVKVDTERGTYDEITKINGFLRGMDRIGDYLFVAMSKLRESSSIFQQAPISENSNYCGISIIYIPSGKQVGYIIYQNTVDELFDLTVLPRMQRPNLLNIEKGVQDTSIVTKDKVFWYNETNENELENETA